MKKHAIALLTLSLSTLSTFAFAGSGQQDTTARLQAAGTVISEIMAAPDKGIPEEVLNGAKCINNVYRAFTRISRHELLANCWPFVCKSGLSAQTGRR